MAGRIEKSVCALDCPDTCALLIKVDEAGHGSELRGDPSHPITRGFLCAKVAQYLEREYHPDRLLHPLRRSGAKGSGQFSRISWDEALDEVTYHFRRCSAEFGPESILPYSYAGTMGMLNGAGMDRRFFHRLGASQLDRTICSAAGGAALTASQGIKLGTEPEQFAKSKLIIAWGANILGTNVHLWPFIVEARRQGARFYVIDPVKNRTGRLADKHFAVSPGSDLALALGMIHVIVRNGLQDKEYLAAFTRGFEDLATVAEQYPPERAAELTGIPAAEIEALAIEYATTRPAVIRVNYGVQRSERGGSAVRAIAALPVLTGAWREVGGGIQLTTSGAFEFDTRGLQLPELQQLSPLGRPARIVNMSRLGHALNELDRPRVHALCVYNSNPAAIAPNQSSVLAGLRRSDLFTVVLDHFLTDTARYADIVLPATTFLEHTDLYLAYGHYYLQFARPALARPGEVKSNVEIFRALARRMDFKDAGFEESEDDMIRGLLRSNSEFLCGITLEHLEEKRSVRLHVSAEGTPFLPFAQGGFRTPSGKFEFGGNSLDYTPPVESRRGDAGLHARFPLEMISSKNDDSMNSTFGYRSSVDSQTAVLTIHPGDAEARGIRTGMLVRAFNDRGFCFRSAFISDHVKAGVVHTPSVRWNILSVDGLGVNQLTSERLTDLGGGATFYSCLVDVAPAE
jgi:anaerobic selenocysteine-containing dehydrogenase